MKNFQKKIKVNFTDLKLLQTAFTHRSSLNESKKFQEHNERLEFLWDAVLELSVTNFLYNKYPADQEWHLTSLRSALVKKETLAGVAKEIWIWKLINLSRWEELTWWRDSDYLLANTIEALIWAIYLDRWFKHADEFVKRFILAKLDQLINKESHVSSKSKFQAFSQGRFKITPTYKVLDEFWPDHEKTFTVWILLNEVCIWVWIWLNKQNAQDQAANNACKEFDL